MEEEVEVVEAPAAPVFQSEIADGVYKKWHKTGFINVGYWAKANKVTVEIGSLAGGAEGGLASATKVFLPGWEFLAYLRGEIGKNVGHIMPDFGSKGYEKFGGGKNKEGQVIARVFSSKLAQDRDGNQILTARTFKCGHYEGTVADQGAIKPNYSKKISENMIRLTLFDIAQIFEVVNMLITSANINGLIGDDAK